MQLREFGVRAWLPSCLNEEKKLPRWQLDQELLRAVLHPGFPITVPATCDDVPRIFTLVRAAGSSGWASQATI